METLRPISACRRGFQKLDRELAPQELKSIVQKLLDRVKAIMSRLAPGSIKNDIVTDNRTGPAVDEVTGKTGPSLLTAYKAWWIEKGVRAVTVLVKDKKVLANKVANQIYGRRANIPARPGKPFIEPAARLGEAEADRIFKQELDDLVMKSFK